MAYKLVHFLFFLSFSLASWIQNPSPILTRPFDAKSAAMGGINTFEKSDISSIQFSYSSSDKTIFKESSILFQHKNKSYYLSYFGIPDLNNTIDAWSDNGDGIPTSDEIDYTRITSFDYRSIKFIYPVQEFIPSLEAWPTFSFSSLYGESAYSVEFSLSKRLSYKNAQLSLFIHDAISTKWWSTNRREMYLPFLELIVNMNHDNMNILLDGILSSNEFNGRLGTDVHINKNLRLRVGYDSSGIFSFGTGIKLNFIELDIAVIPSDIEHPFKPTQQFTLKLLTEKVRSATKRLRP